MAEKNGEDRELGWDDEVKRDSGGGDRTLVEPGRYKFHVAKFTKGRYQGGDKIPPCPMATLKIDIIVDEKVVTYVEHRLYLCASREWILAEFFRSIGFRKHGQSMKMDWSSVPGAVGECQVFVDPYVNAKGESRKSNKIEKFYDPPAEQQAAAEAPVVDPNVPF